MNQRPQPISITDGIRALELRRAISKIRLPAPLDIECFALPGFPSRENPQHEARRALIERAYSVYKTCANSDVHCGDVLERVVHASFNESQTFGVIHSEIVDGAPAVITVGGRTIDNSSPVDHLVQHQPTGVLMLVEDKNIRDWFYPDSRAEDLARMIAKALTNNTPPMLVTRKVPYVTRLMLKRIGILAFEMHHQYFHPEVADEMAEVRHTDGLGFHDVRFTIDANPNLTRYLDRLSSGVIEDYADIFRSNEDVLTAFAVERSLGFFEFLDTLGMPWQQAYDYGDF